jgi:hypothetical protein
MLGAINDHIESLQEKRFSEKGNQKVNIGKLAAMILLYLELSTSTSASGVQASLQKALHYNQAASKNRLAREGKTARILRPYIGKLVAPELTLSARQMREHSITLAEKEAANHLNTELQTRLEHYTASTDPIEVRKKCGLELAIARLTLLAADPGLASLYLPRNGKSLVENILRELDEINKAAVSGTLAREGETGKLLKAWLKPGLDGVLRIAPRTPLHAIDDRHPTFALPGADSPVGKANESSLVSHWKRMDTTPYRRGIDGGSTDGENPFETDVSPIPSNTLKAVGVAPLDFTLSPLDSSPAADAGSSASAGAGAGASAGAGTELESRRSNVVYVPVFSAVDTSTSAPGTDCSSSR